MKQSTFSAQVANNLLTLLQGYSKTIRLLLVMFLTLTASTAWGAKITTYSSIVTGKTYYIGATTGGTDYYLSVNGASTSTSIAGTAVTTKANATAFVFTGSGTSWNIKFADYANYLGLKNSKDNGKVQVVSSAATFTASNQSGKLRLSIGSYSIQKNNSGTQFGSYGNTQTDIWLEEVSGSDEPTTTYTIKWHTAVGTTTDDVLNEGAAITKPATDPTMTGYTFMGWTEDCEVASDGAGFTAISNFGTATEDKDYYAVFAEATTTGGGGGSTTGSKTLVSSSNSSYYQSGYITGVSGTNNASWTADGFTMVQNKNSSSNAVALNYAEIRVYASHSIVFTPTSGSTITSIVATATTTAYADALGGSSIANCTKSVSNSIVTITPTDGTKAVTLTNTAQSRLKTIVVYYTTSGGGSTSYNNYITTCAGAEPEPDPIPVTGVSLDITSHTMNEGETVTLIATVTPDDADDKTVTWKSSDENIAKVNTNGIVTAVSPGNATITVTTTDGGKTATCDITVTPLPTVEGTWTLVTDASNLKAGDRIVIAAAEYDFALSTTQNSNNRGQAAVTKNGNNITFTEATQIITLEATGESTVPFAFSVGTAGYLYAAAANSNYLKTKTTLDDHGKWAITINADTASIIASNSTNRNVMQYNKSNGLFACYASASQEPIAIYKEGGGATTYTITSTLSHVTADGGNPTTITSEAEDLTLSYSAESGWNLPATISVTMGGTPLSSETDYAWDNGYLLIAPASGFTGNIVVTVNGWQQLAAPTGLNVKNITSSGATLSWNTVTHATSYTVQVYGETDEIIAEYTDLTQTTKEVSGLESDTYYIWAVTAIGDGTTYTDSEESETAEFTTSAVAPNTYTITFEANGGTKIDKITDATALPAPLPTTTRDHYTFAGWFTDEDCTQAATAGATINAHTTLYAKWTPITYTVTFDAGSGTYTSGDIQGNFETGLELPTATPCDYASTNGWRFVGWSETTVSETTVRPAIHTDNYKPTKNITLHAVYAKTGTAEGAVGEFILSLEYKGTTYYVGQTFDNSKLSAETEQTNAARFTIEDNYLHYEGGYISHVATKSSTDITRQTDKANAKAWTITEEANTIIFTSTADNTRGLGFNYNNGSPRFAAYQLSNAEYPHTFTKTSVSGGNVQVTTYNSNPSCEAPVDPNWVAATITHTAIKANCGSTTVLDYEGENGPATISFSGTYLQNSVTVTASDGFLVSINKTNDAAYSNTVTVNPVASGENQGKITQNVHVIADATAKNESYTGTITLTGADITNGSQVINVTAAVTCTQYTITWSVNGDDSHQVTYSPGDALQLPSIPVTPCDGMDHVGWTDNMGYVHGTDILFTETTDMTVTSDKTYYAVFAASTSSDDGAETILDFTTQGYANQATVTSLTINAVTVTFSKGTNNNNPPKYYSSGTAVRVYGGNTFTVSSDNTISKIVITFGSSDGTNEITTDSGDYSNGTWTGSANEITFTIGGTSGNRRIASIAVTSAGGGASYYTDHTTTCEGRQLETPTNLQATDITYNGATLEWDAVAGANSYKVVINGQEPTFVNTNSYTTHALKPQTAYTWTVQAIGNGTTFTDSEISAEATFTTGTALTITWSVSTNTTTTTITKGQPIGANLKTPATPAACEGKYFMGWSASSIVNSDGSDFTPITSDIVPETNVTYYAVFAEPTGNGGAQGELLFSESFDSMDGKGGNDGEWSGNIATVKLESFDDWTLSSVYKASACIKLGTGSLAGSATTPALGINGNATLTFDAGAWNGNSEKLIINLTIVGDGSIEPSSVTLTKGQFNTYTANITGANADTKVQFIAANAANNRFFLDEVKVSGGSSDSYTDYSTSCGTYTVTFYGFNSGGYTTTCNDNPAEIAVAQGETYQIPNCEPTDDPAKLGRTFAGTWNTQANGKGTAYKPGDEFIVNSDITLYAQWKLETTGNITLPADKEDLATTDIIVTGGKTLTIPEGETITINSLTLKGGLLGANSESGYAMPSVVIPEGATLVRKNTTINLDLVVNNDSWYPFAVPFAVANNSNIDYLDPVLKAASTYNTHFAIKTYDGENRAKVGTDQENNWDKVLQTAGLQPGKGYIISAMTYPDKDTATIRIPMSVSNDWLANGEQTTVNEVTRNTVKVTAYTGDAATEHQRHAGWNFVANPYLANFAGTNASGSFINGEIIINKGDYSYGGEDVPYVTIPTYNFAHYYQVKLSEATLSPAYSFFVQVGTDGTMTFDVAGRQQAPASIAARNAEERPVKMDVDITLSDNHSSDQTGIIISDRYSEAYEIGRDLEKLFGSAYNLSVYTLMADNTPLAFQALAIRSSMQVIPVGYRTPAQGEYTFRLNEATSSIDLLNEQYEQLVLVDYQTGELTNLLIADYTFYSERTQADNRFAIYAVPRQNAPTDLPNAIGQDKEAQKIIHNGHLYILRDGNVYNGNGQIVK